MKTILFFSYEKNPQFKNNFSLLKDFNLKIFSIEDAKIISLFKIFIDEKKTSDYVYFASDDIDYLTIVFRLYNQLFENFIFLPNNIDLSIKHEFDIFIKTNISDNEKITKSIYYFDKKPTTTINIDFKQIKNLNEINKNEENTEKIQKVFHFENKFLITEFINFDYKIIKLDDSSYDKNITLNSIFSNLDNHLFKHAKYILESIDNPNNNLTSSLSKIRNILNRLSELEQKKFIIHFKFLINTLTNDVIKNYLDSFLVNFNFFSSDMFNSLINDTTNDQSLTPNTKYFLFWQYLRLDFIKPLENKINQEYLWSLYKNIYNNYKNLFSNFEFISKEKRNENLIFIFTGQFLGELHAPTKLLLERAYHLKKNFNKEILIINTSELLTKKAEIPFFESTFANKVDSYSNINQISYRDIEIPFYQSNTDMPDENEILNILSIVQEYKPYFILNIGSGNLTADLCSNLVTTVSFPTTSDIAISESQIHIHRSELTNKDFNLLKKTNIDPTSIVISHPRGEIISKVSYTRKDFSLPEDKFLLSVVGNRLTQEITEEFISMLNDTLEYNTYIVFIGTFDNYEEWCKKFPNLRTNSTLLEYQEHLYDVMKLFDLSVNPGRVGGAHGSWYSMMSSIPIVTLNFGDVHILSKGKFSTINLNDMKQSIIKYTLDKSFYQEQSKLSLEIFLENTSVQNEINDLLLNIYNNLFFR